MLLTVWEMYSSFYIARAMIGRKETNDSLEKKKRACLDLAAKQFSFSRCRCFQLSVFALKMDKFLVTEQGMLGFLC